ncbi:MAG: virulence factor [Mangrovicoccus sp.]
MADITCVFWRDIPAQIIVGKGRKAAKLQLPERFEQAIDRAAMTAGLDGSDDYLAQWRKEVIGQTDTPAPEAAAEQAARLEAEYDQDRMLKLIRAGGIAEV